MTNFAIRYSYFDRVLGGSGHGEAIVRIQTKDTGDIDADAGEGEGKGKGNGESEGQGDTGEEGETINLDDPEHRQLLEQHIKEALTREYTEHNHGQLVVIVTDCSPVPQLEGEGDGESC